MSRPIRLEFEGALYHVTSRGDRREDIYETDDDRHAFLQLLGDVCKRVNWVCHAYCLMSNHYHVLIETPDANLSRGMRDLNGKYTQRFNRAHYRVGHVFNGFCAPRQLLLHCPNKLHPCNDENPVYITSM